DETPSLNVAVDEEVEKEELTDALNEASDEETDENDAAEAEVEVDTELEEEAQSEASDAADSEEEEVSLVEAQSSDSLETSVLAAEKLRLEEEIAAERYISEQSHRELELRINEIKAIIATKVNEIKNLDTIREAKRREVDDVERRIADKQREAAALDAANSQK